MTKEDMQALVKKHADLETQLDLEGVLATLVANPIYEIFPARLRLEGKDNVRQFYQAHFTNFFPMIKSFELVNECWGEDSACLEYDLYLQAPAKPNKVYRICTVLTAKDSLLVGERFYVSDELAWYMTGDTFENFKAFD